LVLSGTGARLLDRHYCEQIVWRAPLSSQNFLAMTGWAIFTKL
jgi:hypothetical protein